MSSSPPPPRNGPSWLTYIAFTLAVMATKDNAALKRDVQALSYRIRQLEYAKNDTKHFIDKIIKHNLNSTAENGRH
jgi:hypothetical protein